jgi:hypothetical protein
MMPSMPSEPINSYLRSMPVLSLRISQLMSSRRPSGSTASKPRMLQRKGPYLIKYLPPACVDIFPPIRHEPLIIVIVLEREKKEKFINYTNFYFYIFLPWTYIQRNLACIRFKVVVECFKYAPRLYSNNICLFVILFDFVHLSHW